MDSRILVAHVVKLAIIATLAGLYATGRSRRCVSMVAYLWAALIGNSLTTFWPDVFFEFGFWTRRQAVFDLLKLGIGIEVSVRAFRMFPGARATWERLVAVMFVVATSATFLALPRDTPYGALFALQPRIVAVTVWLFTITALVVVYYRIPLDSWHRAILLGFAPYQFVFTTVVGLVTHFGYETFQGLGMIDAGAYLVLTMWWAQRAWRKEEEFVVSPALRRILEPERA